jgi:tRNA splicing ligase
MTYREKFELIYLTIDNNLKGDLNTAALEYKHIINQPDVFFAAVLPANLYAFSVKFGPEKVVGILAGFLHTYSLFGGDVDGAYKYYCQLATAAIKSDSKGV